MSSTTSKHSLNGICPYFTMFPLEFPYSILKRHASQGEWIIDPFCGRGTTNYASRILGLPSIGIDSSPVAVALSQAKLANASLKEIVGEAIQILSDGTQVSVPEGEFWSLAYHPKVLRQLCSLRASLLVDCSSDARIALRAIILGALHGPRGKKQQSYFSNQSQRTYAPKPRYSVNYWKKHDLRPEIVDVIEIIRNRAERYYSQEKMEGMGQIVLGDSRDPRTFADLLENKKADWVITSPPYYGMRTYIPDQWLRYWFLGGSSEVTYTTEDQLEHSSFDAFSSQLRQVWENVGTISKPGTRLVVRFGSLNDRKIDAKNLLKQSLNGTNWKLLTARSAGSAAEGYRQSLHFSHPSESPREEFDVWAKWQ